ncbi:uncharacterized protein TRUGW13939_11396 [Talaromyces rugulosus]|uniref:DUF7779 domain-containing protein n=1 Tax=Talaromyces rugulosus TaxID=121627 RepID=A0A7H8RI03_TALRU|nr:uncharacterized protein TRUGW13939_11396 [Talaromyces rugulosus]QKX64223.1 hypothetical protein TRUGW13939_11396 [Talaromyces rugulosus]
MCLTNALERVPDFKDIVRAAATFVAIATPHSKSDDPREWNQPQLLAGIRSYRKRGPPTTAEDARQLASLCRRFETVVTNLHILTICEAKETPIKSIFVRVSKGLIVPRDNCRINSRLEEFIEINANHLEICNLTTADHLARWVRNGVNAASARIPRELPEDPTPTVLSESTKADHDAEDLLWNARATGKTRDTSNQATEEFSASKKDGRQFLSDFAMTKRDPCLPCHIIPQAQNRDFYGRENIVNLIEYHLAPIDENGKPKRDLKTFALCGPGGIGKTQAVTEYAYTHRDMYEAILWVHAQEATILADEFSRIAETLGLVLEGTADARDQVVTRELVKGWLAKPVRSYNSTDNKSDDEVSWLLVFDNMDNADLISEYWPPTGSTGSILVTSRDTLAKTLFYQINDGIDLPPLSNDHAANLLLKLTWREEDIEEQKSSVAVAEKLGGLPLALVQMAGVMIRQSLSFADFLKRYEEEETHDSLFSLSLQPSHKRMNYAHTLASVWSLEDLQHSSGLLDVMAFFDPDGIPEKYLLEMVGKAQLPGYPQTVTAYQDARSELLKSSLDASNLTIHRLIQDAARAKMQPDRATEVFSTAVDMLWTLWPASEPGVRHHIARWKDCEMLAPHILRLRDHYIRAGKALKLRWVVKINFPLLMNELGWYFQERGYTPNALECYEIAQSSVEHIINTHNQQHTVSKLPEPAGDRALWLLAEIHNNTAGAAVEYNDADLALQHFQIYNKMFVTEHEGQTTVVDSRLTSSFFNVGLSYAMRGD